MFKKKERILIYRMGSMGDTVIALPCFHKVRQSFPNADITLLTNRPVMLKAAPIESIIGKDYFYDRVISYPVGTRNLKDLLKLVKDIRELKIDTVINLTAARSRLSVKRDYWFFRIAGISRFIGFPKLKEDFEVCIDPVTGYSEWEAERLTKRLSSLGYINLEEEHYWDLRLTDDELKTARELVGESSCPIITISLGTKNQSNDWGINNWSTLINRLSLKLENWKLVIIGAETDKELGQELLKHWGKDGLNLCALMTPRVSAAVLQKSKLFVGHDSGPMHLAACVGTPCIGIFSARNLPGHWFPRGKSNTILYNLTECAGCRLETCIDRQKKCILSITIQEVEDAIIKIAGL